MLVFEQIENLKLELSRHSVLNYESDNLIKAFSDDNLLFKRVLKLLFYCKLSNYFDSNLKLSDSIDEYFPRRWRLETIKEFKQATNLETPKMILSSLRTNLLIASIIIPLLGFIVIFFYKIEYLIIPTGLLGLGIYIFLATLPAIMIGLIYPRFFNPLDWPEIKVVDDFLDYLVIRNWDEYRNDSFLKSLVELKEIGL